MTYILQLYPVIVWFVVIVGIVALISCGAVWIRGVGQGRIDHALMSAFIVTVDLEAILGILHLFSVGPMEINFSVYQIGQGLAMFMTGVLGHSSVLWSKFEPRMQAQAYVIIIIAVFVLIFISLGLTPQRWDGPLF